MTTDEPIVTFPHRRRTPLDPPPELAAHRSSRPIVRMRYPDGHVGWLVTSHDLGRRVLADRRFSMAAHDRLPIARKARMEAVRRLTEAGDAIIASGHAGNFLRMDPPDHTRFRRALASEFSVHRMRDLRPRIDAAVAECLDAMIAVGPPVDLVEHFALAVPTVVICELLAVPFDRREAFHRFSSATEDPEVDTDSFIESLRGFADLMADVVSAAHDHGEGVLGRLAVSREFTDLELWGLGRLLVAAGHHTTKNMLALAVFALFEDRDRWQALVDDPGIVPAAVEELLRHLTTFKVGAFTREATEDVPIGDVVVARGDSVTVSLPAANRDPDRFERPDEIDFDRRAIGHLAFGHGIHMCLGQHLAREELQSALTALADRLPSLDLAIPADRVVMHPDDVGQAGPARLPVTW